MESHDSLRCCNNCGRRPTKGNPLWRGKEDRLCIACVKEGVRVTRRPPRPVPTSWADPTCDAQPDNHPRSSPDSGFKVGAAEAAEQDEADKASAPLVVVPAFQPTMQQQLQAARLYSDLVLQEQAHQLRAQKAKSSRSAHELLLELRARQWRQQRGGERGVLQPLETFSRGEGAGVPPSLAEENGAAADAQQHFQAATTGNEEAAQQQPLQNGHAEASPAGVRKPSAPPPPPPPPPATPPQQPTVPRLHQTADSPEARAPVDGCAQPAGSGAPPQEPRQQQYHLKPMPFSLPAAQSAAKPGAMQGGTSTSPGVAVSLSPVGQQAAPSQHGEQLSAPPMPAAVTTLQDHNGGQARRPLQVQAVLSAQQPQLAVQLRPASAFGATPMALPPSFRPVQQETSEARLGATIEEDREVQAFKVYFLARYGLRYQAGLEELARYRRDDLLAAIRLPGGEEEQVEAVQRLLSRRKTMACCVCS